MRIKQYFLRIKNQNINQNLNMNMFILKTRKYEVGKSARDEILASLQNDEESTTVNSKIKEESQSRVLKNDNELDSLLNDIMNTKTKTNKKDDIDTLLNDLMEDNKTETLVSVPIINTPIIMQPS